jgi:hypothetical protein
MGPAQGWHGKIENGIEFFSMTMGAQIPLIVEKSLPACGCRKFQQAGYDGRPSLYLYRYVTKSRGRHGGDIQLTAYFAQQKDGSIQWIPEQIVGIGEDFLWCLRFIRWSADFKCPRSRTFTPHRGRLFPYMNHLRKLSRRWNSFWRPDTDGGDHL